MGTTTTPRSARRPNVLLLVTDDQGAWAMGSRMPELHTPTLDRLQRQGTTLEHFFCASPVCSPARASLVTGRMPSAHGVHDWLHPDAVANADSPRPPFSPDFLERAEGADSLGAMFSRSGYRCGMVGKWHVGSSDSPAPGFEYWWAHQLGGGPYYDAPTWAHDEQTGRPRVPAEAATEPAYLTDAITRQSLDFLRRVTGGAAADGAESGATGGVALGGSPDDGAAAGGQGREPFFLQVNWTAPHDPWFGGNHPQDLLDLYADTDFPSVPRPAAHPWFMQDYFPQAVADPVGALRGYCAAVSGVDRSIAALLDQLEAMGLLEDTIVVFTSDNGFSCGHHGIWGKGNGTLPLNLWEPSITVPFVVRWPGRIPAGAVDERPASAVDLLDTLAELTGSTPREDPLRAGRSIAPRLLGQDEDGTPAPVVIHDEYGATRMLRTERWKLVLRREGPAELYDLQEDPQEQQNLADLPEQAERQGALAVQLQEWFARHETATLSGWSSEVDGLGQKAPRD